MLVWKLEIDGTGVVCNGKKKYRAAPQTRQVSAFSAIYMIGEPRIYLQISEVRNFVDAAEAKRGTMFDELASTVKR